MINNEWGIRARMWQLLFGDVLVRRVHVLVKRLSHKQEYVEWSSILCVIFYCALVELTTTPYIVSISLPLRQVLSPFKHHGTHMVHTH